MSFQIVRGSGATKTQFSFACHANFDPSVDRVPWLGCFDINRIILNHRQATLVLLATVRWDAQSATAVMLILAERLFKGPWRLQKTQFLQGNNELTDFGDIGYNFNKLNPAPVFDLGQFVTYASFMLETAKQKWLELMETPYVSPIIYGAILIVMLLIAIYVVGIVRSLALGGFKLSHDEDFDVIRNIHNRGMIADEEYQRAKELVSESVDPDELLKTKKQS